MNILIFMTNMKCVHHDSVYTYDSDNYLIWCLTLKSPTMFDHFFEIKSVKIYLNYSSIYTQRHELLGGVTVIIDKITQFLHIHLTRHNNSYDHECKIINEQIFSHCQLLHWTEMCWTYSNPAIAFLQATLSSPMDHWICLQLNTQK